MAKKFVSGNLHGSFSGLDKALKHSAFLDGWQSVRSGQPFDYDRTVFSYEFGRQCAIVTRQVLGYIPTMPGGIDLVRPIYVQCRLDQTIPGDATGLRSLADADGKLDLDRYMAQFVKKTESGKLDGLMGF